jgi:ribosomal protein S18 acetylase RimI-like enzyme
MSDKNDPIKIRRAIKTDLPALCRLLNILFEQETEFKPDLLKQSRALKLILEQENVGRIFCATHKDVVVAMVSLLFTISTAEGGPAAWLEDMIVHPDFRRRHIGETLLQEAVFEAKTAGCTRITLLTDANNQAGMRFYERSGFRRSAMVPMRLKM